MGIFAVRSGLAGVVLLCGALAPHRGWAAEPSAGPPPGRIVSLLPSLTELLFALDLGDRVVGVSDYCADPPEVSRLPRVGGLIPNLEKIVSLKPDLILADISQEEGLKRVRELGLELEITGTTRLKTLDEFFGLVARLGAKLGRPEKAEDLVRKMREALAKVEARVAGRERPRVLYVLWWDPLIIGAREGLHHEVLERAGGRNVGAEFTGPSARVSDEFVVREDPEVILVSEPSDVEKAGRRPGWAGLKAVRDGRVMNVGTGTLGRYGPRLVEGIAELSRKLHPEGAKE